jgi:hypothetical protein
MISPWALCAPGNAEHNVRISGKPVREILCPAFLLSALRGWAIIDCDYTSTTISASAILVLLW